MIRTKQLPPGLQPIASYTLPGSALHQIQYKKHCYFGYMAGVSAQNSISAGTKVGSCTIWGVNSGMD